MSFLRTNARKDQWWVRVRQTAQLDSAAAVYLTFSLSGYVLAGSGRDIKQVDIVRATDLGGTFFLFGIPSVNDAGHIYVTQACIPSSICLVSLAATVSYPYIITALIASR